jgi:two-component system cell cycle response regulator
LVVRKIVLLSFGMVLVAVPMAFALAVVGVGSDAWLDWLSTWGSAIDFTAACVLSVWRGSTRSGLQRSACLWLGLACGCWAGANLYYALAVAPDPLPLPSVADIGYVGFPIAMSIGVVQYARTLVTRIPADVWLDGLVAALGTAALGAAVLSEIREFTGGVSAELITSFVYPLGDVAVIAVLVGVASLLGSRFDTRLRLIVVAVGFITAADLILFSRVLAGNEVGGAGANLGWTVGIGLVVVAQWLDPRVQSVVPPAAARHQLKVPVAFAFASLGVLSLSNALNFHHAAAICAIAALAVACLRLFRSYAEVRTLADSRRLALTDDLTGLSNRRQLLQDLEEVCDRRSERFLAIYDLDGFKNFNDTFGHPAGDELLTRLAGELAKRVAADGVAYRLGGDEFCVIAAATAAGQTAIGAAAEGLTSAGPGWSVASSVGVVQVPQEADTVAEAMRIADRRMYAQKDRRPGAARQQARDVLLSALGEQQPNLRLHVDDVTQLTGDVARSLGMSPEAVDDVIRAAELHDIGKIAIPREILDKPGPLTDVEWELMRQHTIIGERLLRAAPALRGIAPLVLSSHERWDGGGYPHGLAGEAIPLGSRIVAICDSFDAMVGDRSYRPARTHEEAVAELRRCSGTQFDPRVVDAFLASLAREQPVPS